MDLESELPVRQTSYGIPIVIVGLALGQVVPDFELDTLRSVEELVDGMFLIKIIISI